ncbi:MAG: type II toxin-antitoxin system RelE/ParE family toxin [Verrucomicrobiaceae bacterium]|jgi:mRNA interferase RelE/StbE|nr:type II toxin-antitoxin system RelE/ParE family toxin [Verrucomicrobiaceae bacterium]
MAYTLEFEKAAIRSLKKLPPQVTGQVEADIRQLCQEPRPPGCKKLKGHSNLWRVRSGDYRVIYQIRDERLIVLIVDVGHRSSIYN